jgi:hypothetical protein
MATLNYGAFESYPAHWNDEEAWVLFDDKTWTKMSPAEVIRLRSPQTYPP